MLAERNVETKNIGYPTARKAIEAYLGPKPGVHIGYSNVLFSDGERRTVRLAEREVYNPFLGAGWVRTVYTRVWDYTRMERVEVEGYLRATDEGDLLFVQFPETQEFQLPEWELQSLFESYGYVVDGRGQPDCEFAH